MAARKARKKPPGQAPAIAQRVRARAAPEKADRLKVITGLMAGGRWITGVTVYDLARKWALHEDTVKADAAEASRRIHDLTDDAEVRGQIILTLQTITQRAMNKGELRTAVESVKALAGITGVEAPKNVNVGGTLAELFALAMGNGGGEAPPAVG